MGQNMQLAEEIRKRQDAILKDWIAYQVSALTLRRDLLKESELRESSRQFMESFAEAFETGEERIRMTRPFASIHDLNAARLETHPFGQLQQAIMQRPFGQGSKTIEQGQDQHRRENEHEELKRQERSPGPKPP